MKHGVSRYRLNNRKYFHQEAQNEQKVSRKL